MGGPQSGIARRIDVVWISHCLDRLVFISCNRRIRKHLVRKSVKLAAEEDRRRLLVPLLTEPEDSGIDSDRDAPEPANLREPRVPSLRFLDLSEASASSDDEPGEKPWWRRPLKKNNQRNNMMDNQMKNLSLMQRQPKNPARQLSDDETSVDRASPPLYEVELTASDEEDDGSVLELVIPMQSTRFQRVPLAAQSPKKILSNCLFCTLLCCARK